jgi:hypothetical protein
MDPGLTSARTKLLQAWKNCAWLLLCLQSKEV